jgi:hypothetical protein
MGLVSGRIDRFSQLSAVNNGLTWGEVGAMKVSGRPVRNAFLDAKMVCLSTRPTRMRLYKFNSFPTLRPDENGNVTPWWSAYDPYDVDPGWPAKLNMARHLGVSVRELGRVTSAITESWNSLEYLVVITLKVDIWAAYGRFAQMLRHDKKDDGQSWAKAPITHQNVGAQATSGFSADKFRAEGKAYTRHLPGGGRQFFVPNLKPDHYTLNSSLSSSLLER